MSLLPSSELNERRFASGRLRLGRGPLYLDPCKGPFRTDSHNNETQ